MLFANAGYVVNDVVEDVTNDPVTEKRYTTYRNTNGNYNARVRVIFNTPLRNKKFSINNMFFTSCVNTNSFINGAKNTNLYFNIQDNFAINYRSDLADFGLRGDISHGRSKNSLEGQKDLSTYQYGGGANTTFYLPYDFKIESDLVYSTNSGYSEGFELNEWLWNASLAKSFLKGNAATLRLKIYDILQQRSNISYTASSGKTSYSEYNTLNSYFIVHFIYRFSIFKGGAGMSDMRLPAGPGGRGGLGGFPGGGRPPI
jgi:hypothetical protein